MHLLDPITFDHFESPQAALLSTNMNKVAKWQKNVPKWRNAFLFCIMKTSMQAKLHLFYGDVWVIPIWQSHKGMTIFLMRMSTIEHNVHIRNLYRTTRMDARYAQINKPISGTWMGNSFSINIVDSKMKDAAVIHIDTSAQRTWLHVTGICSRVPVWTWKDGAMNSKPFPTILL